MKASDCSSDSRFLAFQMVLQPHEMEFCYQDVFKATQPEAYERLILDAIMGDNTLFIRDDEVDAAWRYVDTVDRKSVV